jgi:protoheme ferro-lyase
MNRQAHPWLKPSMEKQIGKLAGLVSEEFAKVTTGVVSEALEKVAIKVKGNL